MNKQQKNKEKNLLNLNKKVSERGASDATQGARSANGKDIEDDHNEKPLVWDDLDDNQKNAVISNLTGVAEITLKKIHVVTDEVTKLRTTLHKTQTELYELKNKLNKQIKWEK